MSHRGQSPRPVREARAVELVILFAVSLAFMFGFVRPVVASPVFIGSGSMIPSLHIDDRLLINKLADDFSGPERGDIVLVEDPAGGETPLIKRVVGLPNETVEFRDGVLFVDGERLEEPYTAESRIKTYFRPILVPQRSYFLMGDNRSNSLDSRVFGPVPEDDIIGEAFFRFWPLDRIGTP